MYRRNGSYVNKHMLALILGEITNSKPFWNRESVLECHSQNGEKKCLPLSHELIFIFMWTSLAPVTIATLGGGAMQHCPPPATNSTPPPPTLPFFTEKGFPRTSRILSLFFFFYLRSFIGMPIVSSSSEEDRSSCHNFLGLLASLLNNIYAVNYLNQK